ncbi:hypothetical protein HZ326_0430 [Fusarium oxysporum f. sp. albedinis]|nr:hypothetical protein HZ326_0430 [Fusarium oxysporum f. sp. albedinis]
MRSFNSDGVIRVAPVETRSVSPRTSSRPIKAIYRRLDPSCQGLGSLCFMLRHSTNQQAKLEVVYLVTMSYTQRHNICRCPSLCFSFKLWWFSSWR